MPYRVPLRDFRLADLNVPSGLTQFLFSNVLRGICLVYLRGRETGTVSPFSVLSSETKYIWSISELVRDLREFSFT